MKVFKSSEVTEIDKYTIENEPVSSTDLMERAASKLAWWFTGYYKIDTPVLIIAGPGNNGGDALALARILKMRNYKVEPYLISSSGKLSEDCKINLDRLKKEMDQDVKMISDPEDFPEIRQDYVIVEGVFGSGLSRPAGGVYGDLIRHINNFNVDVVSIDIPSGLFGEDNSENTSETIIRANHTLTFQFPFLSFFFSENEVYTGKWHVLGIGLHEEIINRKSSGYHLLTRYETGASLKPRKTFSHKGTYGHALSVAGSYGMMGAAMLTGEAALRSGAGLVTMHIPGCGYQIVQTAFPEAIVSIDPSDKEFSETPDLTKYTAIAAGPGLGTGKDTKKAFRDLLVHVNVPLVIDADGINMLAEKKDWIKDLPENTIITPHPAEFDRLAGSSVDAWSRHLKQLSFSKEHHLVVVLKGAYTGISLPNGKYYFNSTGNPGMATGGSGDVLTGIIVSLLAQGYKAKEAALIGVYLHGMAGDIAAEKGSFETLIAGDIISSLGDAFKKLLSKPFLHEGRPGGGFQ